LPEEAGIDDTGEHDKDGLVADPSRCHPKLTVTVVIERPAETECAHLQVMVRPLVMWPAGVDVP